MSAEGRELARHIDLAALREDFERKVIRAALLDADGNQTEAAKLISMKRTTLVMKMKRLGIHGRETKG